MSANLKSRLFTPEEYLVIERMSETRSEYLEGMIYAMVGASLAHNTITMNISGLLWTQLKGKPCRAFANDLKVRTSNQGLYAYPDVMVVCSQPLFHDNKRDIILNPTVIIEVLSPSTEDYDRGKKAFLYRQIKSLTDYLLIAQNRPEVEYFQKNADGAWLLLGAAGLDARIEIPSIQCTLPLAEIYDGVAFDPNESSSDEPR